MVGYPRPSVSRSLLKNVYIYIYFMTKELSNRNRLTDMENKLVVTKGKGGGEFRHFGSAGTSHYVFSGQRARSWCIA